MKGSEREPAAKAGILKRAAARMESEREAAAKAAKVLKRATDRGDTAGDHEYGAGKLTKHQRKSQERHIPFTEQKQTLGAKIRRNLIG